MNTIYVIFLYLAGMLVGYYWADTGWGLLLQMAAGATGVLLSRWIWRRS